MWFILRFLPQQLAWFLVPHILILMGMLEKNLKVKTEPQGFIWSLWGEMHLSSIFQISEGKWCINIHIMCAKSLQCVWLFVTPWAVGHQAPLFVWFSRQEAWIGLPFPSAGDLPDQRLNLRLLCLLHWQAGSLPLTQQLLY